MRYFALLFLALFLASCSDSPKVGQESPQTLLKSQLEYHLVVSNGLRSAEKQFSDSVYYLPSEDWIKSEFLPKFEQFSFNLRNANKLADCDDFADLAKSYANLIYPKSGEFDSGLAFGKIFYRQSVGKGHAINLVLVKNEKGPKMLFLEPQTSKIVSLSKEEVLTASLIGF